MSGSVRVLGADADRALAGLDASAGHGAEPVVALGATPTPEAEAPAVRWLDRAPPTEAPPGRRLIAPAGAGLWSRRPWPAADELFELPEPARPRALLVGDRDGLREVLLTGARGRGLDLLSLEQLDRASLAEASCVVLLDGEPDVLPALAPAVLAARRILVAPRANVTFGLQATLDHLQFGPPDRALDRVHAVLDDPAGFERMRVWGALAAERHRASMVYARLAMELAEEEEGGSRR